MKSGPDDNVRNQSSQEDLRCVWMAAGILSYQLCDRQFDCDRCPLDAALRMHFSRPREADAEVPVEVRHLHQPLYSRNHCWIESLADGKARIGIEPGLASVLASPKAVVLPSLDEKIRHEEWCAWIVMNDGTLPLRAPLSGRISAVNARLSEHPSMLSQSPYQDGWLFEMELKADEPVRSHLMARKDAERFFEKDMLHFRQRVRSAISGSSAHVGPTLHDGGEFITDASAMLGGKYYLEIVREAFHC